MSGGRKIQLDVRTIAKQLGISETNMAVWEKAQLGEAAAEAEQAAVSIIIINK